MAETAEPLMAGAYGRAAENEAEVSQAQYKYDEGGMPLDWCTPQDIRMGFVRKVYGILTMQLLLTALIATPFVVMDGAKQFVQNNPGLLLGATLLNMVFMFSFVCGPERWRREVPINYALLFGFTACEGILVGCICAQYTGASVLLALGLTVVLVLGLTIYALTTKHDFTGMGPYLFAFCWAFLLAGLVMAFLPVPDPMYKIYAGGVLILFSMYLVFDTQLVVGGEHKQFQLTVDDYVFGAMILYIDIIQLFLQILELLGRQD